MDLLERQVPCEGFVRRIASSFSNKINCNDKTKSNFQKYPLSRNSFSFSGAPMQKALSPSVADIKKILESSQNTSKNIEKVEKKSNRSKSLVNRITSSLRSKPNEQVSFGLTNSIDLLRTNGYFVKPIKFTNWIRHHQTYHVFG